MPAARTSVVAHDVDNDTVSRRPVTKVLKGANGYYVRESIRCFEQTVWEAVLSSKTKRRP